MLNYICVCEPATSFCDNFSPLLTSGNSRNENSKSNGMERSGLEYRLSRLYAKPFKRAIFRMEIFSMTSILVQKLAC